MFTSILHLFMSLKRGKVKVFVFWFHLAMTAPVLTKGKNAIFVKSRNGNDETGKSR